MRVLALKIDNVDLIIPYALIYMIISILNLLINVRVKYILKVCIL